MGSRFVREEGAPPFFGRKELLAEADRLLEQSSRGLGGGLLVKGAGGIGKSQVLRTIARRARGRGFQVLSGRALPEELPAPFSLIRDLVRSASSAPISTPEREEAGDHLPLFLAPFAGGREREGGARTAPGPTGDADELEGLLTPLASVSPEGHVAGREELLARLGEYFLELARRRPLVLAIDDLHFADSSSLDFLLRFTSELAATPVAVFATVGEQAEVPERTRSLLEELAGAPAFRSQTLLPLSSGEAEEFVRWILGGRPADPQDLMRWQAQTEGNPLLIEQLVRATMGYGAAAPPTGDGARDATQIILARIENFSDPERRLLTHAAVLGKEFDFSKLASVSGESEERVTESLDRLVQDGVVREKGNEVYEFVTEAVRATVYSELTETRRRLLHRRIARALEARGGASDSELARQFYLGREDAKAVEYNWRAAQSAARAYAFETALSHLARALECERRRPDPDLRGELRLLTEQGRLLAEIGDLPHSIETLDEAIRLARPHPELGLELGRALLGLAQARIDQNEYAPAATLASEALDHLEKAGSPRDVLAGHRVLGMVAWRRGELGEAEHHQKLALEIAERDGTPLEQGHALVDLGNTMVPLGSSRFDAALDFYTRAARLFATGEDHAAQARVLMNRAVLEYGANRVEEAFADLQLAIVAADRSRSPIWIGYCHLNLAQWHAELGHVAEAREALERAATAVRPMNDRLSAQQIAMSEGMIAQAAGDFDTAEVQYQRGLALSRELATPSELAEMLYRLAALSHARGDLAAARARLAEALAGGLREHRPDLAERVETLERQLASAA